MQGSSSAFLRFWHWPMKCTNPSEPLTRVRQGCTSTEWCFFIRKAPELCWFPHCAEKPRVWTFSKPALSASRAVVLKVWSSGQQHWDHPGTCQDTHFQIPLHIHRIKNSGVGAKQFVFQKLSRRFRRMLKSGNHCSEKGQLSWMWQLETSGANSPPLKPHEE